MGRVTVVRPPPPERARRGRVGREPGVSALWVFHHPRAMGRSPLTRGPCLSSCPTSPAREHHRAERGGRGSIAPPHLPSRGCGTEIYSSCTSPCRAWQGYKGSSSQAFGERRSPGDRTRPSGLRPTQQRPFGYLCPLGAT